MSDNICSICLEPLLASTASNNIGSAVPCGHCFHQHCFYLWKSSRRGKTKCPNCYSECKTFVKLFISFEDSCKKVETPPKGSNRNTSSSRSKSSSKKDRCKTTKRSASGSVAPSTDSFVPQRQQNHDETIANATSSRSPKIQDNKQLTITTHVTASRTNAPSPTFVPCPLVASLSLRHRQTKAIKELRVTQQTLVKQVHDRNEVVRSSSTLREEQKTKRIRKLQASQHTISNQILEHQISIQSLQTDSLRTKDKEVVNDLKSGLNTLWSIYRGQQELIHSLYTEKIFQVQNKVATLKVEQCQLRDTLLDYGAALKFIQSSRQHSRELRKLEREQQILCTNVNGIGESIGSLTVDTLQKGQLKNMAKQERALQCFSKRISDHGEAIQSICAVQRFFSDLR